MRRSDPTPDRGAGARSVALRLAVLAVVGSSLVLAGCSGGKPAVVATSTTGPAPTTGRPVAAVACEPSAVAASVDYTAFGGANSSLAGAVVFRDTATIACTLTGVPSVRVLAPDGSSISTYAATGPARIVPVVLTPAAPAGTGHQAAASITFSAWQCALGSFSLTVRFPGWSSSVPAGTGAGSTTSTTAATPAPATPAPCTQGRVTGQTVYMGPVTSVTG